MSTEIVVCDLYKITYNLNGGTSEAIVDSNTYATGASVTISSTIPTKPGFVFDGWMLNEETVSGTFTMPEGGATLVAQWKSVEIDSTSKVSTEANFKATSKDGHVTKIDEMSLRMYIDIGKEYFNSLEGYEFSIKLTLGGKSGERTANLYSNIVRDMGDYVRFDTSLAIPAGTEETVYGIQLQAKKGEDYNITLEREKAKLKPRAFISYIGMFKEFCEFVKKEIEVYNNEARDED